MRRWLRRRRERVERIEDEAGELVRLLGGDAYGEARWREQTASSRVMAKEWNLIALAIARRTGRRIGLDVSTRMAMNVVFAPDRKPAEGKPQPDPAPNPLSELKRNSQAPPAFGGQNRAFPISSRATLRTKMNRNANKPESPTALARRHPASTAQREGVLGSCIETHRRCEAAAVSDSIYWRCARSWTVDPE